MSAAVSNLVKEQTCHMLASGMNQTETAAKLNISTRTVDRIKNSQRDKIISIADRYISASAELILDNHIKTLKLANTIISFAGMKPGDDGHDEHLAAVAQIAKAGIEAKDLLKLSDLKEFRTLQIMGIIPGSTSIVLNQLIGNVSVNLVDPGVRSLLGGQLNQLEDDSIEAEVIE